MSRYDLDHDPDELRSESVRKPQESSGDHEMFRLRGQGGSSGSAQEPPKQHPRHENLRDSSKVRRSKDVDRERQPTYDLLDSELHTLADLGAFRAINFGDLVQYRYNGNQDVTRSELNRLARAGFIRRQIISRTHSEQYTLTRLGRQAVESHRDKESAQTLYHGFVKWREADHDAAVYKLYQKAADDIARSGGRVTRVVLDFELKRSLNRQLARTAGMSPEEQARRKQEIAEEHGLKVIDGRVVIPDLRLEYETPDHEQSRVDLEVVTGNYRSGGLSAKARAGFRMYASAADQVRLRAAMTDPEIMQEILSL
jgi:hypothetical protein